VYPKESAKDWQNGYKQLAVELAPLVEKQTVYLLPADDRFYLWMMGYGPYTGVDFQSWKSKDYKFEQSIPNLVMHPPNADEIKSGGKVIIAGEPQAVASFIQGANVEKLAEQDIVGDDGVLRFVITVIENKPL
jgi:hypothetical protein